MSNVRIQSTALMLIQEQYQDLLLRSSLHNQLLFECMGYHKEIQLSIMSCVPFLVPFLYPVRMLFQVSWTCSVITSVLSERSIEFTDLITERSKILNPEYSIDRDQPTSWASPLRINTLLCRPICVLILRDVPIVRQDYPSVGRVCDVR